MQKVEVHNSLRLDVMHSLGFNVIYTFGDFIFKFFFIQQNKHLQHLKKLFPLHYFLSQAVSWYITLLLLPVMLFWQK